MHAVKNYSFLNRQIHLLGNFCCDTLQHFSFVRFYLGLFSCNILSLDLTDVKLLLFKPATHESYLHADKKFTREHWRKQDPPVPRRFSVYACQVKTAGVKKNFENVGAHGGGGRTCLRQ